MSLSTGDMQAWCFYQWDSCERPPVMPIDESKWFSPKPASAMVAPPPSGMPLGTHRNRMLTLHARENNQCSSHERYTYRPEIRHRLRGQLLAIPVLPPLQHQHTAPHYRAKCQSASFPIRSFHLRCTSRSGYKRLFSNATTYQQI